MGTFGLNVYLRFLGDFFLLVFWLYVIVLGWVSFRFKFGYFMVYFRDCGIGSWKFWVVFVGI